MKTAVRKTKDKQKKQKIEKKKGEKEKEEAAICLPFVTVNGRDLYL